MFDTLQRDPVPGDWVRFRTNSLPDSYQPIGLVRRVRADGAYLIRDALTDYVVPPDRVTAGLSAAAVAAAAGCPVDYVARLARWLQADRLGPRPVWPAE